MSAFKTYAEMTRAYQEAIQKQKPAQGLPERATKVMRYVNLNKKKNEVVEIDLSMGTQTMIRHWDNVYNEGQNQMTAVPVYGKFVYCINKGWVCEEFLQELDTENEFGPISP